MATRTSVGTGNWSAAGTWDTGVPVDGDSVVIASGHVVTFDVDQSAFATGIAALTITGSLICTDSAGSYELHMAAGAVIGGAGSLTWGSEVFAAKHTLDGEAGYYINGSSGLTCTVIGAEPETQVVYLSAEEAVGQTELSVDADVTGDIWAAGDIIRIDNNNGGQDSEERIIAAGGIASDTITITAGLTATKKVGSWVYLITRNTRINSQCNTNNGLFRSFSTGKITFTGGMQYGNNKRVFLTCPGLTISGGTFSASETILRYAHQPVIEGGVFSSNTYVFYSCVGANVSGGYFSGNNHIFSACVGAGVSGGMFGGSIYAFYQCVGAVIFDSTIKGNQNGFFSSSAVLQMTTFDNNTYDFRESIFTCYGVTFSGTTDSYNYANLSKYSYSQSSDHDEAPGTIKAWTKGGITTSVSSPLPTGITHCRQTALENADVVGFWQREISVAAGESVNINFYLRKDGSMSYLPRGYVFDKAATDPFAGGDTLHTFTMTDSVDTWEDDSYTYSNNTSENKIIIIRFLGKAASGNMYSWAETEIINVDLTTLLANLAIVDSTVDSILVATSTTLPASIDAVPTAAENSDAVWANDERTLTTGSFSPEEVWNYASRTLTEYSGSGSFTAQEVWEYADRSLTMTLNQIRETIKQTEIVELQGNTWENTVTGTFDSHKQIFAIKEDRKDPDSQAILLIDSSVGLVYLNKQRVETADESKASLSLVGNSLTYHVDASISVQITAKKYKYGAKSITAAGVAKEYYQGIFEVEDGTIDQVT